MRSLCVEDEGGSRGTATPIPLAAPTGVARDVREVVTVSLSHSTVLV